MEVGPFKVAFLSKWGFHSEVPPAAVTFSHEYSFWFVSMCKRDAPSNKSSVHAVIFKKIDAGRAFHH